MLSGLPTPGGPEAARPRTAGAGPLPIGGTRRPLRRLDRRSQLPAVPSTCPRGKRRRGAQELNRKGRVSEAQSLLFRTFTKLSRRGQWALTSSKDLVEGPSPSLREAAVWAGLAPGHTGTMGRVRLPGFSSAKRQTMPGPRGFLGRAGVRRSRRSSWRAACRPSVVPHMVLGL